MLKLKKNQFQKNIQKLMKKKKIKHFNVTKKKKIKKKNKKP